MIYGTYICRVLSLLTFYSTLYPLFLLTRTWKRKASLLGDKWEAGAQERLNESHKFNEELNTVLLPPISTTAPQGEGLFPPRVNHTLSSQCPTPWPLTAQCLKHLKSQRQEFSKFGVHMSLLQNMFKKYSFHGHTFKGSDSLGLREGSRRLKFF